MPLAVGWIRDIAAGIAEGVVIGWTRAIERLHTAVEEAPNDADRARAIRMRDAVLRLPGAASDTGPINPAPPVKTGAVLGVDSYSRWKPDGKSSEPTSRVVGGGAASGGG